MAEDASGDETSSEVRTFTDDGSAKSLLYYMNSDLSHAQRDLLMTDYAARRATLTDEERAELDDLAFERHLPPGAAPRSSVRRAISPKHPDLPPIDIGIVAILHVEWTAVCNVFDIDQDSFEHRPGNLRFHRTTIDSIRADRPLRVVVTLAEGAYDLNASDAAKAVLDHFDVKALFLVGIAAGNPEKLNYGDVVMPRTVMNYEAQRMEPDSAVPRGRSENIPREVGRNFNYYDPARTGLQKRVSDYCKTLKKSQRPSTLNLRRFRPKVDSQNTTVAVGALLVADGKMIAELRKRDDLIQIVDQDSYGFARACRGKWWGVFRGISDHGDPDKSSEWHFLAASVAALTLKDFLNTEYVPPEIRP